MSAAQDVIVAGAGPAGCVAAIVLARAGVRVRLLDRAQFPRDKLCGDTVNPGTLSILRRLGLDAADQGLPVTGMLVTGPGGVRVATRYPGKLTGRALVRRELDYALLRDAASSGALVDEGVLVRRPLVERTSHRVCGVEVQRRSAPCSLRAPVVIAADGRGSRLARSMAVAIHPPRPRRWAVGAYFANVAGLTSMGEMHVRAGHYIGVAPLPGGLANACLVTADRSRLGAPDSLLARTLGDDWELGSRFSAAEMIARPVVLGPLAVDCLTPGAPGLLLAGDAAGFIDPMTGDGLRFALRGAVLAAQEALRILETGDPRGHERLAIARRCEFAAKWRFNRTIRRLVDLPDALRFATYATRLSTWPVGRIVRYAGDVDVTPQ